MQSPCKEGVGDPGRRSAARIGRRGRRRGPARGLVCVPRRPDFRRSRGFSTRLHPTRERGNPDGERRGTCRRADVGRGRASGRGGCLPPAPLCLVCRRRPDAGLRVLVHRPTDPQPARRPDRARPASQRHPDEPAHGLQLRGLLHPLRHPTRPAGRLAEPPRDHRGGDRGLEPDDRRVRAGAGVLATGAPPDGRGRGRGEPLARRILADRRLLPPGASGDGDWHLLDGDLPRLRAGLHRGRAGREIRLGPGSVRPAADRGDPVLAVDLLRRRAPRPAHGAARLHGARARAQGPAPVGPRDRRRPARAVAGRVGLPPRQPLDVPLP